MRGEHLSEQKKRSTIALIGLVTLVAFVSALIAAIAQQAIFGKTRAAAPSAVAVAAAMAVAWRKK